MEVVPRRELATRLRAAGIDPDRREFVDVAGVCRATVLESDPPVHVKGPHRKVTYPDGRVEGPFPVCDRPRLSRLVGAAFESVGASSVLAVISDGALWLNNKAQAGYLWRVPDAQAVARFLRQRGLTDRFRGGFLVSHGQFLDELPKLAAHTFTGGSDVLFVANGRSDVRLTILSCHHFDLHVSSPNDETVDRVGAVAAEHGLVVERIGIPEEPDLLPIWSSDDSQTIAFET